MKLIPAKHRVRLNNCPYGLFLHGDTLAMMTEYSCTVEHKGEPRNQRDAYIVSSGEYFWGGAKDTVERGRLLVTPVQVETLD